MLDFRDFKSETVEKIIKAHTWIVSDYNGVDDEGAFDYAEHVSTHEQTCESVGYLKGLADALNTTVDDVLGCVLRWYTVVGFTAPGHERAVLYVRGWSPTAVQLRVINLENNPLHVAAVFEGRLKSVDVDEPELKLSKPASVRIANGQRPHTQWCPFCSSRDVSSISDIDWIATHNESDMDTHLTEYQCTNCGSSFWT